MQCVCYCNALMQCVCSNAIRYTSACNIRQENQISILQNIVIRIGSPVYFPSLQIYVRRKCCSPILWVIIIFNMVLNPDNPRRTDMICNKNLSIQYFCDGKFLKLTTIFQTLCISKQNRNLFLILLYSDRLF